MKIVAVVGLCIIAVPAEAGSISISITNTQGTITRSATLADADVARIIAAYRIKRAIDPATSDQQVLRNTEDSIISQIKADVRGVEQDAASKTAGDAVQSITAVPQ